MIARQTSNPVREHNGVSVKQQRRRIIIENKIERSKAGLARIRVRIDHEPIGHRRTAPRQFDYLKTRQNITDVEGTVGEGKELDVRQSVLPVLLH